jgi:hypothetical protein
VRGSRMTTNDALPGHMHACNLLDGGFGVVAVDNCASASGCRPLVTCVDCLVMVPDVPRRADCTQSDACSGRSAP